MSATLDLFGRMAPADPPPRAQLTVFYSGTVNVYDDVPADKAHAIMFLLHSNKSNPATISMVSNDHLTPSVNPKDSDPVPSPCDTNVTTSSMIPRASSNSSLRDLIQPLSRSSAPPSPLPSSPFSAPQTDKKQQIVCKRSQAELPFARKASLARFLEKRKDRVQPKLEQEDANHLEKKMKLTTENKMHQ